MSWKKNISLSALSIWGMALVVVILFNFFKGWKKDSSPFVSDTNQYHSYLVAAIIHKDLSFSFEHPYWTHKSPTGQQVNKFTLGVAIMELPFFLTGHVIAHLSNHKADGYSAPYSYSVTAGIIIYVFLALFFIRKILLNYFDEFATTMALLAIFLASNLHYYTVTEGAMSHSYLFFLTSLILYCSMKWHHSNKYSYLFASMFVCGFATVLRPTNVICIMIPLLYGISNMKDLSSRIKMILNFKTITKCVLFFILATLPQLIYWKWATGSFIYYSYDNERFFFEDPKIFEFLFSFTKGWFIYTPVMIFSFIGIFLRSAKHVRVLNILFIGLITYILSSWWCWWYGGSYGMRAMVEYYSLLSIPLAAFFQLFSSSKLKKSIAVTLITILISWNIISEIKYKTIVIYWDGMTYESYKFGLLKIQFTLEERKEFESKLYFIDAQEAMKGRRN